MFYTKFLDKSQTAFSSPFNKYELVFSDQFDISYIQPGQYLL